ncbi:MAG: hypothetical protein OXT09_22475 [Myxococcales bacterium]|nr:hypothetical protein [Myxococcales bacterium]
MAKLIELDLNPDHRTLRQFGYIALAGFGLLAAFAYYETFIFAFGLGGARMPVTYALGGLAGLSFLLGLVYPPGNRFIFLGTAVLAYPIGFVLSYVIMGVLFFGIIAPIGGVRRALGRDSMHRTYDPKAGSYWSKAHPTRDKQSYFRQF